MSKLQTFLCVLTLSFLFQACGNEQSNPELRNQKISNSSSSSVDTITLTEFTNWRENWSADAANYMASDSLVYFDMAIVDLQEVINSGADSARFYIGLEALDKENYYPHLMMVGIDSNGTENLNLILDYTKACPPNCPQ